MPDTRVVLSAAHLTTSSEDRFDNYSTSAPRDTFHALISHRFAETWDRERRVPWAKRVPGRRLERAAARLFPRRLAGRPEVAIGGGKGEVALVGRELFDDQYTEYRHDDVARRRAWLTLGFKLLTEAPAEACPAPLTSARPAGFAGDVRSGRRICCAAMCLCWRPASSAQVLVVLSDESAGYQEVAAGDSVAALPRFARALRVDAMPAQRLAASTSRHAAPRTGGHRRVCAARPDRAQATNRRARRFRPCAC